MEHTSAGSEAGLFSDKFRYERHRPERTLFYQLVEQHYPSLVDLMAIQGKPLPRYVRREYEDYLKCGRLKHGFLRLRCDTCQAERLFVFSCKRLVICTSFGARRMVESAALLVDEFLPQQPMRQWVLSGFCRKMFIEIEFTYLWAQLSSKGRELLEGVFYRDPKQLLANHMRHLNSIQGSRS
jgi:hypothetical protein